MVETTPRYVRTILSESQISLMKLRKDYAKNMEKKLSPEQRQSEPEVVFDPQFKLTKIKDKKIAELLAVDPSQELLQISRLQRIGEIPVFVQLITYTEIKLSTKDNSLKQILIDGEG